MLFQGAQQLLLIPSQSQCWFVSVLLDELLCVKLRGDVTCGAFCIRNELLSLESEYSGTVAVFLGEFICAVSNFCISSKPKVGQTVPEQFLLVLLGMSGPWAVGEQS